MKKATGRKKATTRKSPVRRRDLKRVIKETVKDCSHPRWTWDDTQGHPVRTCSECHQVLPPGAIGQIIDRLYGLRQEIKRRQALVKEVEVEEAHFEAQLVYELEGQALDSSRGRLATATLSKPMYAHISNWEEFAPWVIENEALDIFHRRISTEAVKSRLENKELVPGINIGYNKRITLTARKGQQLEAE